MSVSLWLDASVLNTADAVVVPNRTTVNLRAGSGLAMAKQAGGDDIVLSSTSTPTTPGVIGGHVIYTTVPFTAVPALARVTYPFDVIESSYGTPVAALGPGVGEVTLLSTGTYRMDVQMSYIWTTAGKYGFLILEEGGNILVDHVMYSPPVTGFQTNANMGGCFTLPAGTVLKVTVDGWQSGGNANYVTFASSDTRWDITRIY